MKDVPEFLREMHPHASLQEFEVGMSGKILIPQYFGTLKNLYEAESGFCISKFMVVETIVALIVLLLFVYLASRIKSGNAPKGRISNLLETFVVFIRDQVAKPSLGANDAPQFVPFLLTAFFFILGCNLIGMLPFLGTPTSTLSVTSALAISTFGFGVVAGVQRMGTAGYFANFAPHMDLPEAMKPLKWLIWGIEFMGTFIKHGVLAIRLFANMFGGHYALAIIGGLIVGTLALEMPGWARESIWGMSAVFGIVGSACFMLLELLVAFIQAYVFTLLSAIFIGMSIHHH